MKKLICASDVESLHEENKRVIPISENTIVTPSAHDLAEEYAMTFKVEKETLDLPDLMTGEWSKESLVTLLKSLLTGELLTPFILEKDSSGIEIIKKESIKSQEFPTKEEGVTCQTVMHSTDGTAVIELLSLEDTHFIEQQLEESFYYVISGEFDATLNEGKTNLTIGDLLHIPKNEVIDWKIIKKTMVLKIQLKGCVN